MQKVKRERAITVDWSVESFLTKSFQSNETFVITKQNNCLVVTLILRHKPYALIAIEWLPLFRRLRSGSPEWKHFITIKHSLRLFLAWMAKISVPSKLSIASRSEATVGVMKFAS